MDQKRFQTRVRNLMKRYGVYTGTSGAFIGQLRDVEFLLHEVAHWLTLGCELKRLPQRLSKKLADQFDRMSVFAQNELELDACLVTYLTGYGLGLWEDPAPLVTSCRRNLKGLISLEKDSRILSLLGKRYTCRADYYEQSAKSLAKWLRPSAKILPFEPVRKELLLREPESE